MNMKSRRLKILIASGMNDIQTNLVGRSTTSYATEISKMIPNPPTFPWQRGLPKSNWVMSFANENLVCWDVNSNLIHVNIH